MQKLPGHSHTDGKLKNIVENQVVGGSVCRCAECV